LSYFESKIANTILNGSSQGKTGVVCVKTLQAIIVGHYGEEVQPGDANVVVEKLADYLIGLSY